MNHLVKFLFIFILAFGTGFNLLYAQNESDDGFIHPVGLQLVKLNTGNEGQDRYDDSTYWLTKENLIAFTDIKNWMKEEGLDYNEKNLNDISEGIHQCINKMWRDAIRKLLDCDTFNNHLGGDTKKKFLETINDENKQKNVLFKHDVSPMNSAQMDPWNKNLELPLNDLELIARYYLKKMAKGEYKIGDFNDEDGDDVSKHFHEQTGYVGHEMLHAFAGIESFRYPGDSKNPKVILAECMAHCLQGKCLDQDHRQMMSECNGEGEDTFCDKNDSCEFVECNKKYPPTLISSNTANNSATTTGSSRTPGGESPDDNYSHSSGMYLFSSLLSSIGALPVNMAQEFFSFTYYPDILIYDKFNYPDLPTLLEKDIDSNYMDDYSHECFSTNHKLLIIPSGELMGEENSGIIKQALEQFVASGGTLLVMAQQYNTHFENLVPVPEGETLKAYGWRQDQSCYNGAVYFDALHPVVSSSSTGLVTAANDGYFDTWPSTATVLLNRTKNREGALLYYPYGENGGHVILTSLYTDWGYAHSQATSAEIKIIRDLITFAKNPNLPIPMYNLKENANPDITLDVVVKNNTDIPAGKVKVIVSDPNREIVLYESEEACISNCIT